MTGTRGRLLESHSIDFVPLSERYGTPRRLFTLWFSANLSILGVTVGALGVMGGLSAGRTALGLAVGNAIGTVFVAAHSAQGPRLGIPQMIQSRAQFGVLGAAIPLVAVVLTYLLYSAADGLITEPAVRALVPIGNFSTLLLFAIATLVVAFAGYELIHKLGFLLTAISGGVFAGAAWLLAIHLNSGLETRVALATVPRTMATFTLMVTQGAAWSLSYGPFVADYSRYLPPSVSSAQTFWYTGLGCFLGSSGIMALGAYLAAGIPAMASDPGSAVAKLFGSGSGIVEVVILVGLVYGNVMNLYSAYMSTSTIFTGMRGLRRISALRKLAVMTALMGISVAISITAQDHFSTYFSDILSAMIYLLVPWSAINLADYYLVRKGDYIIEDMFNVDGIYGAYQWKTILIYLIGIAIQQPFMSFSFYKGAVATMIGADIAWLPGLVVPGVLYVLLTRGSPAHAKRP